MYVSSFNNHSELSFIALSCLPVSFFSCGVVIVTVGLGSEVVITFMNALIRMPGNFPCLSCTDAEEHSGY